MTIARTRLELDERRRRLVDTGLELFSSRPYDEISIDDIAAAAGVSKGLLYHYFESKRDFYVATVRTAVEEMREATAPDPGLDPGVGLEASLVAYLDHVEHHAVGYATVLRGGIGADPEVAAIVDGMRAEGIARVVNGLGLTSATPSLELGLRGWIGFVEAASLEWLGRDRIPRDDLLALIVHSLAAVVAAARRLDPSLPIDPAALSALELGREAG